MQEIESEIYSNPTKILPYGQATFVISKKFDTVVEYETFRVALCEQQYNEIEGDIERYELVINSSEYPKSRKELNEHESSNKKSSKIWSFLIGGLTLIIIAVILWWIIKNKMTLQRISKCGKERFSWVNTPRSRSL